ncbi:MAG TPA: hypothetical protein VFI03_06100 [Solirubrobacterales bacterium]|nr:hypothetical protein [Solirubrobacterales bacterium]
MAESRRAIHSKRGNDQKLGGMKMNKARTRLARMALALAVIASALGASSTSALAAGTNDPSQFEVTAFSAGTSDNRAGARTDFRNRIELKHETIEYSPTEIGKIPYGTARRLSVKLPPGLVGDPTAYPTCSVELFLQAFPTCPQGTEVGTMETEFLGGLTPGGFKGPVYNLTPGKDEPALFGIKPAISLYTFLKVEVSPDGEITAISDEMPIGGPLAWAEVTMFGVPTDHGNPSPRKPFMTNPTNCSEPFAVGLEAFSYEGYSGSAEDSEVPLSECADVPFAPSMSVTPTSHEAGAPTGLNVDISVPQSEDPDGLATAHVKDVTMTLPEGLGISSSSANGLGSCSPDEFGYHEETPISCPLSSKIGEVEVETPILEEPLSGPVYIAKQNDNPFDSLLALYMAPQGSGVTIKLAGKVDLDPATGRITTTFLNNPQQPFSDLHVRLKDGPLAPLALPRACGTYTTTADLRSWSMPGVPVELSSSFSVDQGCGREGVFTPGLRAGTLNPTAGAFSPFTMRITRGDDAQANISRLTATLPEGMLAKLSGVPLCSDVQAATGDCPEASKVGHTTVGAGAGAPPVFVPYPGGAPTALYLAGPYNGGPYSLIAEVPAQAGPFDLGTVILKNALRVNPTTAQVTAISDPLPQFLQGVPISYRDIRVDVDRPNFTLNPTSCEASSVAATIEGSAGQAAQLADPFRAGNCEALGFKPKLSLHLKGGTKRGKYPKLRAVLKARPGDANIGRVSVALPHSAFLAQEHIKTVCTRVQYAAKQCPLGSIYGYAKATTPLLDQPLEGPVYLRSSSNPLPDLVAALHGAIEIDLAGRIDSVNGGIRSTFETVPDAPVTKFVLEMKGGKKGLLVNSRDLCKGTNKATVKMDGQNGKGYDTRPVLTNSCGKKARGR